MSKSIFAYSIGRKLVMALSGLFLISFLVVHMSGNLQLFTQDALKFNEYTRFMTTNPIIKVSELILVLGFALHIFFAWKLNRSNNEARPVKYAYNGGAKDSSWMSRNMGISGSILLIFLVVHLGMFWREYKFGGGEKASVEMVLAQNWKVTSDIGTTVHKGDYLTKESATALKAAGVNEINAISMYKVTADAFKNPLIVLFYVSCMIMLGLHLAHAFASAFQSLGFEHKKYTPLIEKAGKVICMAIPFTFGAMPIFFFFVGNK